MRRPYDNSASFHAVGGTEDPIVRVMPLPKDIPVLPKRALLPSA